MRIENKHNINVPILYLRLIDDLALFASFEVLLSEFTSTVIDTFHPSSLFNVCKRFTVRIYTITTFMLCKLAMLCTRIFIRFITIVSSQILLEKETNTDQIYSTRKIQSAQNNKVINFFYNNDIYPACFTLFHELSVKLCKISLLEYRELWNKEWDLFFFGVNTNLFSSICTEGKCTEGKCSNHQSCAKIMRKTINFTGK